MTVEKRIRMCLLIEKMSEQKEFSGRLGIENVSTFRGEKVRRKEGKGHVDGTVYDFDGSCI